MTLFAIAAILLCLAFIALALMAWRLNDNIEELLGETRATDADHAKCMALITQFIGDEFAARVLDAAAEDYGTTDGQARLVHLRWTQWREDGPSMPAVWMKDRAASIRGPIAEDAKPAADYCTTCGQREDMHGDGNGVYTAAHEFVGGAGPFGQGVDRD